MTKVLYTAGWRRGGMTILDDPLGQATVDVLASPSFAPMRAIA